MTGGGSQLTLVGVQDKYLHYKADHSFFESSHVTYENFAIESMEITGNGTANFGRTVDFTIPANSELIAGAAMEVTLPALTAPALNTVAWMHSIGFYCMTKAEFKAQAQTLDTQYAEYMDMWSRLTVPASKRAGYNDLIGEINLCTTFTDGANVNPNQVPGDALQSLAATKAETKFLVPFQFWWCDDYTQAIPIGILLYSTLRIRVYFRAVASCYIVSGGALATTPSLVEVKLYIDYVFLDDFARNRLAQEASFYVITQVQHDGSTAVSDSTYNYKIPYVMPVLHLMWGVREDGATAANVRRFDWWDRFAGNATNLPDRSMTQARLRINAQDRLDARDELYFTRYVPYKHHTTIPTSKGIWMYSFALQPENSDASGAANLSRSENNNLNLTFNTAGGNGIGNVNGELFVFARNYNYIYIEAGFLTQLYNA
jgi:hypothetical protein